MLIHFLGSVLRGTGGRGFPDEAGRGGVAPAGARGRCTAEVGRGTVGLRATGGFLEDAEAASGGGGGDSDVDDDDDTDDRLDRDVLDADEDAEDAADEELEDEDEEDSLESYFRIGFGGDGNSSQFTQPSLAFLTTLVAACCDFRACLGLCKAWLANSSQGFCCWFRAIDDLESCLGNTTLMGAPDCSDCFFSSSNFPTFLGEALLGLSTEASLHSMTLLLLGVMVTVVPVLS